MECDLPEKPYWDQIMREEVSIHIAEKAAREIENLVLNEGLNINTGKLRQILFEELDEKNE